MTTENRGDAGKHVILGLGTGRCGTHSLAELLDRQPESRFTHEECPLLPWSPLPGHPGIAERLQRMRQDRAARFIGDVASFYLPYAEEAISVEPDIRMICLERPREQVVSSFARLLDTAHPLPTDHWSRKPAAGWYHDPFWSRIFPKYDVSDRAAGIRLYWDEYHRTAAELARRFPRQFRVFPIDALNSESGRRELLSFAGIPGPLQVVDAGITSAALGAAALHPRRADPPPPDLRDPRHCAVLVPYTNAITPACESALRELERLGYEVRRACGPDSLDRLRSRMATAALCDGFHELMWIGPEIEFAPRDVDRLRAHDVPVVCALYPRAGLQTLCCNTLPGMTKLIFGEGGGLHEIEHAGGGFLLVRRQVLVDIQKRYGLPICDEASPQAVIPFFQPVIGPHEDGYRWLESDFGFCEFARQCGYRVLADTSIRLWFHGAKAHSWEDAGSAPTRYATYCLTHQG